MNVSLHSLSVRNRVLTVAAWVVLAASPFILLAAVSAVIGQNAFQSNPVWTDELDYWRGVFSWLHTGGSAGYNGIGEQTALLGTLSVHGITPVLLYGWYAVLFGWDFSSIVICNALWISLGAATFCALNRPSAKVSLGLAAALTLYAPVVLYCATSMTELANYGLLLFYLAFLVRLISSRKNAREKLGAYPSVVAGLAPLALGCITAAFCCAYRITYIVLFIPLVLAACDGRPTGRMGLGFLAAFLAAVFTYYFTALLASPYASGFLYNFIHAGSISLGAHMFLSHAKANLLDYFVHQPGSVMEGLQRWLYCAAMVLTLLGALVKVEKPQGRLRVRFALDGFSALAFCMLLIPFVIVVCAYETNDWSDYRTLAPFLWFTVAAYLVRGRKLLPALFLAGNTAILVVLLASAPVGAFGDAQRFTAEPFSADRQALCAAVAYDPAATDPFDNTVRTDLFTLETVVSLQPAIGLQTGWFSEDTVGKSRWILTDHLKIPLEGYELVLKNESGSVYRRVDGSAQTIQSN